MTERKSRSPTACTFDVKDRLARLGIEPVGGTPQQFSAMLATDRAKWGKIIKDRQITSE